MSHDAHIQTEVVSPGCLDSLTRRSQADFEIEFYERIRERNPHNIDVLLVLGDLFAEKKCHRRALQVDLKLAQLLPTSPLVFYNLACSHALTGQILESLAALKQAVAVGFNDFDHLEQDADLEAVRQHPEFAAVIAGAKTRG